MILQRVCEEELQCVEECLSRGQLYRPRLHYENFLRCIADLYDTDSDYVVPFASQFSSIHTVKLYLLLNTEVSFASNSSVCVEKFGSIRREA